ncbi:MAG: CbtB-domain containing protein [Gammaproteobacteria bacterium]|nr:CbtB-domain containing protein [Gammaproteobacteria bacterium]MDE0411406.1 CbtB-domain containing protein [Gammaproteobacteria bacterium]
MNTEQNMKSLLDQGQASAFPSATVFAVSAALLIGTLIISGVGLAGSEVIHNAAHDLRHALAFPCH